MLNDEIQTPPTTLFISHASEDKANFVRPLVQALEKEGLRVWYDEFSLKLGDSLRRSIDKGLTECTAGVVVLSPAFFSKEWPQRELDALYSSEVAGRIQVFPIWHLVDASYIRSISPLLADRYAVSSSIESLGWRRSLLTNFHQSHYSREWSWSHF